MKKLFNLQAKTGAEQSAHPSQCREQHTSSKTSCRRTSVHPLIRFYTVHPSIKKKHDLYRISVTDTPVYCLQTLDVKLLHPFMLI